MLVVVAGQLMEEGAHLDLEELEVEVLVLTVMVLQLQALRELRC